MQVVSIDCEMVGVDTGRIQISTDETDALARIVVIDSNLDVLYDSFVQPKFKVVNYRYDVTGIKNTDLYGPKSKPFEKVQLEIQQLLNNKIIVGHSVFHDFDVLGFYPEARQIRDTQTFPLFQKKSNHLAPALTHLSKVVLNFDLRYSREQRHNHCPIEDAKIVMKLYLLVSEMWEVMVKSGEYLYSYQNSRLNIKRRGLQNLMVDNDDFDDCGYYDFGDDGDDGDDGDGYYDGVHWYGPGGEGSDDSY